MTLCSIIAFNKMQSEKADFAPVPPSWRTLPNYVIQRPTGVATWRTGRNICVVFLSDPFALLCQNMTSSTKPEVYNILHSGMTRPSHGHMLEEVHIRPRKKRPVPRRWVLTYFWLTVTYLRFTICVCFYSHDRPSQQLLSFCYFINACMERSVWEKQFIGWLTIQTSALPVPGCFQAHGWSKHWWHGIVVELADHSWQQDRTTRS